MDLPEPEQPQDAAVLRLHCCCHANLGGVPEAPPQHHDQRRRPTVLQEQDHDQVLYNCG